MPKIVDRKRYRQELLQKCFDLFAQKGYGSLTMRQVAKELGVSTGTLYHYFPSKQAIFVQLIEEITERDIVMATDKVENLDTLEERMAALSQFIVDNEEYFYKQTLLFFNFFQQPGLGQPELKEAIQKSYQRYQQAFMKFLGIKDIAIAAHVFCFIDGLMSHRVYGLDSANIPQQMELLGKMIAVYLEQESNS